MNQIPSESDRAWSVAPEILDPLPATCSGARNVAGDGPAVVFVHGLGGSAEQFAHQIVSFTDAGCRALAVDLPGHGGTSMDADDVRGGLERIARRLRATLAVSGIERAHLVGNSLGGLIGHHLVAHHRDLIASATTFGTTAQLTTSGVQLAVLQSAVRLLGRRGLSRLVSMTASADRDVARRFGHFASAMSPEAYRTYSAWIANYDHLDLIESTSTPTMIVRCSRDRSINRVLASTIDAAEANPLVRVEDLPDAGHLANLEAPDAFDRLVLGFVTGEPAARPNA